MCSKFLIDSSNKDSNEIQDLKARGVKLIAPRLIMPSSQLKMHYLRNIVRTKIRELHSKIKMRNAASMPFYSRLSKYLAILKSISYLPNQ